MILTGLAAVDAAMAYSFSKLGDEYVYGAKGPTTFDCSGLTTDAWRAAGYEIGAGTSGQLATGTFVVPIGANQSWGAAVIGLLRGDLLFIGPDHVQLYDGEGWIIEAPHTGATVQRVREWATSLYAVRRVVPATPGAPLLWAGTVLTLGTTFFGTGRWQDKLTQLQGARFPQHTVYDATTVSATRQFQRTHNLPPTGNVDKATWMAAFK